MTSDGWHGLVRVASVGTYVHLALLMLLQISGKPTLADVLLSSSVTLAEGVVALGLLAALQYVVTWASQPSRRVERRVTSAPASAVVIETDGTLTILGEAPQGADR